MVVVVIPTNNGHQQKGVAVLKRMQMTNFMRSIRDGDATILTRLRSLGKNLRLIPKRIIIM